jgi:hypothetical protein
MLAHSRLRSISGTPLATPVAASCAAVAAARRSRAPASFHSCVFARSERSRFSEPDPSGDTSFTRRASCASGGGVHLRSGRGRG